MSIDLLHFVNFTGKMLVKTLNVRTSTKKTDTFGALLIMVSTLVSVSVAIATIAHFRLH